MAIHERTNSSVNLSAIVVGALIALLIDIALTFLGSGIGLATFSVEEGEKLGKGSLLGAGAFVLFTTVAAFFCGGYISARLAQAKTTWESMVHGCASFALSSLVLLFVVGTSAASGLGSIVTKAGMGVGAGAGGASVLDQLQKAKIVTDLSILKGKAVTEFVLPNSPGANTLKQSLEKAGTQAANVTQDKEVKETVKDTAADVRKASASVSLGVFGLFLLGTAASIFGGRVGLRAMQKEVEERSARFVA